MSVETYSPGDVALSVGGNIIKAFMEGTFIAVEREVDAMTKVVGADGEVSRVRSSNKSGQITITLKQTSPSNGILGAMAADDEKDGSGTQPLMLSDNLGYKIFAGTCWVRKRPNVEYSSELSGREWVLDMDRIDYEEPAA